MSDADSDAADSSLPEELPVVRDALIAWYEEDHREFPWRETEDPYAILVADATSQQTQLGRDGRG